MSLRLVLLKRGAITIQLIEHPRSRNASDLMHEIQQRTRLPLADQPHRLRHEPIKRRLTARTQREPHNKTKPQGCHKTRSMTNDEDASTQSGATHQRLSRSRSLRFLGV